jgi:uncharacterized protein DUF4202
VTRLASARAWVIEVHPHAPHLIRTEHWVLELDPQAAESLRLAAVLHDIERAFPDPESPYESARDWDDPAYNRWHQDRCADIAARWLREQEAPDDLTDEVEKLVRVHEEGGWREADQLQAADGLSFLETMVPLVAGWPSKERAAAKLRSSLDRMAPDMDRARELGRPMLDAALKELG